MTVAGWRICASRGWSFGRGLYAVRGAVGGTPLERRPGPWWPGVSGGGDDPPGPGQAGRRARLRSRLFRAYELMEDLRRDWAEHNLHRDMYRGLRVYLAPGMRVVDEFGAGAVTGSPIPSSPWCRPRMSAAASPSRRTRAAVSGGSLLRHRHRPGGTGPATALWPRVQRAARGAGSGRRAMSACLIGITRPRPTRENVNDNFAN